VHFIGGILVLYLHFHLLTIFAIKTILPTLIGLDYESLPRMNLWLIKQGKVTNLIISLHWSQWMPHKWISHWCIWSIDEQCQTHLVELVFVDVSKLSLSAMASAYIHTPFATKNI